MIATLLWLLILLAVLGIILWAVQALPLPQPARVVAYAILAIIALVIVARALLPLLGGPMGW